MTTALNAKLNKVKKKNLILLTWLLLLLLLLLKMKYLMLVIFQKNKNKATKISKIENKITTDHDHDKYITTQEFNKSTSENLSKQKQANLASKSDISNFIKKGRFK